MNIQFRFGKHEPGKGHVTVGMAQQLLLKAKGAEIDRVIRYYDWAEEPKKTSRELNSIANADTSVAVIFQHHNDCLCAFVTNGRDGGSAIYFRIDGMLAGARQAHNNLQLKRSPTKYSVDKYVN